MLVLAIHTVEAITATVPLFVLLLRDLQKREQIPANLKLKELLPTSGFDSTSLWESPDVDSLQVWLDTSLPDNCHHTCFQFNSASSLGVLSIGHVVATKTRALTQTAQDKASVMALRAQQRINELEGTYHVTEKASTSFANAKEATSASFANAKEATSSAATKASELVKSLWNRVGGNNNNNNDESGNSNSAPLAADDEKEWLDMDKAGP